MQSAVFIQFAKYPVLGNVKTRLARFVGEQSALDAHIRLTAAVNQQLNRYGETRDKVDVKLALASGGGISHKEWIDSLTFDYCLEQPSGDLGAKMQRVMFDALEHYDYAFIVGSDFPVLDDDFLQQAINSLSNHDFVFAPTEDGGFGLVGQRACGFTSFGEIEWGTNRVLEQVQNRMTELGFSFSLLDKRFDVDELEDWKRWLQSDYS
ncbi:hypothetical protein A3762_10335 [Oleiphilus sp. HI0125]|uniref:TIGR04282 family arsenosugar biosynthesis glycosyltransferase n=3 Tax=unclassified Oleiphilus TaxID=2631174 RepID=UPI0007C246F5|nr:TIGR04282 family arsenosugar biosynthesis glycosyltransferase [Oleiphilus sp. HI0125]KZZ57190.1 hypothetical protein A3762_10335 [Oleiphilus sp. HI0125]